MDAGRTALPGEPLSRAAAAAELRRGVAIRREGATRAAKRTARPWLGRRRRSGSQRRPKGAMRATEACFDACSVHISMRISREHEPDTAAQPPAERAPAASPAPLGALAPTSDRGALARAALGLQRTQGNRSVARALLARKPAPPDYLVTPQFCGVTVAPGVNPTMAERLAKVEKHLHEVVWPAMPADAKIDRKTGAPTDDVDKWLGIGSVAGWKPGAWHASGSAVDVDAVWGPYIATRNFDAAGNPTYGGEEAGENSRTSGSARWPSTIARCSGSATRAPTSRPQGHEGVDRRRLRPLQARLRRAVDLDDVRHTAQQAGHDPPGADRGRARSRQGLRRRPAGQDPRERAPVEGHRGPARARGHGA